MLHYIYYIHKLANKALKHNFFELGKDVYLQILGTAIGKKFAPHYGDIFRAGLEEEIIDKFHFQPYV